MSIRCLYSGSSIKFKIVDKNSLFGKLCDNYHGVPTTTRDAWKAEKSILKQLLSHYAHEDGQIIFEYDTHQLTSTLSILPQLNPNVIIRKHHIWTREID